MSNICLKFEASILIFLRSGTFYLIIFKDCTSIKINKKKKKKTNLVTLILIILINVSFLIYLERVGFTYL